jgi:hypothetical protein
MNYSSALHAGSVSLTALVSRTEVRRTPSGEAYALIEVETGLEACPVNSRRLRRYLTGLVSGMSGDLAYKGVVENCVAALEAKAEHSPPVDAVFVRSGGSDGRIMIDPRDLAGQCVAADASGWKVRAESPVIFERPPGGLALPQPVHNGLGSTKFRDALKIAGLGHVQTVVIGAWALHCMLPGPYVPLVLVGSESSLVRCRWRLGGLSIPTFILSGERHEKSETS